MTNQLPKEEWFHQLISDIDISNPVMDFDMYGNTLFWFDKAGKCVCEYHIENGRFWFNYDGIWSVFQKEYGLNYNDIQAFIRTMVEIHFKFKGVTPKGMERMARSGWKSISNLRV